MKLELFSFQEKARRELMKKAAAAQQFFKLTGDQQVISFTAPTGSGKTVMMAAFVESVYRGDENHPAQSDAIFLWLSDSPELNKQSLDKFYHNADGINHAHLIMIEDDNFNQKILSDGRVYFLNTQKLGKSSNLTRYSDFRRYTIWDALQNTIDEKSERLYVIIDEAHRGMKTGRATAIATTIMQKFIKGSAEDKLSPAPLVIGMSATPERFNALVSKTLPSTVHKVVVTADEVRASGLLKDRIIIVHPDEREKSFVSKGMAMLEAAADDWKDKCDHWHQYCREQHKKIFNPIFVVQVSNGAGDKISETDLDECLRRISARTGFNFDVGEVVHTFGQTESDLLINNLRVAFEEPSHIAGNDKVKVVFFKENLSTGWDCPQAETMMSFRRATDATYIAQLLGRMIRTPMQRRIDVDDTLNDVRLYLPYFDRATAHDVVDALQSSEGGDIPTDIHSEAAGDSTNVALTVKPSRPDPTPVDRTSADPIVDRSDQPTNVGGNLFKPAHDDEPPIEKKIIRAAVERKDTFDRAAVVEAVNEMGLLNYRIRSVRINDYLKSMMRLARLFVRTGIHIDAVDEVNQAVVELIREHIDGLKRANKYDALKQQALQFRLSAQIFDAFGRTVENVVGENLFVTTDTDLDRQFRAAETKLKSEGLANAYLRSYAGDDDINDCKLDVILFAADADCLTRLERLAKNRFHALNDEYRRRITTCNDQVKREYDKIVADSDIVTAHNFYLPETIIFPRDRDGREYRDHLFVDKNTGTARIKLNGWESGVLDEERRRAEFVCWIRNPSNKPWSMCIPYSTENNEIHAMFPDFLIVRRGDRDYIVDILEPHDPTRRDNIGKARGLASYAKQNTGVGRVQLIRGRDVGGRKIFDRLDMSKGAIRERVLKSSTNNELDGIFNDFAASTD